MVEALKKIIYVKAKIKLSKISWTPRTGHPEHQFKMF